MGLGYDQDVSGGLRADVAEGYNVFVLVEELDVDLARDYAAEETLCHVNGR